MTGNLLLRCTRNGTPRTGIPCRGIPFRFIPNPDSVIPDLSHQKAKSWLWTMTGVGYALRATWLVGGWLERFLPQDCRHQRPFRNKDSGVSWNGWWLNMFGPGPNPATSPESNGHLEATVVSPNLSAFSNFPCLHGALLPTLTSIGKRLTSLGMGWNGMTCLRIFRAFAAWGGGAICVLKGPLKTAGAAG